MGYVGTQLCKVLSIDKNNKITVIGHNFKPDRVAWLIENGISYYQRDLFDIKDLTGKVDICYHLASLTNVPRLASESSLEQDSEIFRIGTLGTKYLIDNLEKNAKIIFASTQIVYDGIATETLNITEDVLPSPLVAYSISKRLSELDLLNSDRNCIIARFGSTYGYNESIRCDILPNLFSKRASMGLNLNVFGGNNYKPLIGINDLAECLSFLSTSNYNKEIFHCVSENRRVIEVANICKKYNDKISIIITDNETPNKGFSLSNQKIINAGFKFKQNLDDEIGNMIKLWSNK